MTKKHEEKEVVKEVKESKLTQEKIDRLKDPNNHSSEALNYRNAEAKKKRSDLHGKDKSV